MIKNRCAEGLSSRREGGRKLLAMTLGSLNCLFSVVGVSGLQGIHRTSLYYNLSPIALKVMLKCNEMRCNEKHM